MQKRCSGYAICPLRRRQQFIRKLLRFFGVQRNLVDSNALRAICRVSQDDREFHKSLVLTIIFFAATNDLEFPAHVQF